MKRTVLLAAAVAMAAAASAADASDQGYYFSGIAGASLMPDQTFRLYGAGSTNSSFDAGYAYGGAAGYDSGNGWRVEFDVLHQHSAVDRVDKAPSSGHLQSTSFMLNGTYDVIDLGAVTPYVGAGIGFQDIGASINGFSGTDQWQPAYQAEAGLRHDFNDKLSVFAEYRYSQSDAARLTAGPDMGNQHFSDNAMLTGITYHLGD
ncbi:MAG: outer membrane beta-barrel protein [Alphaproteobacteria bacterium]|nr:outer membrane beta-barrel protein [Alphaproteobacteria bacterium]